MKLGRFCYFPAISAHPQHGINQPVNSSLKTSNTCDHATPTETSNPEETVDIFLNVLWETFTKTFHPRHN